MKSAKYIILLWSIEKKSEGTKMIFTLRIEHKSAFKYLYFSSCSLKKFFEEFIYSKSEPFFYDEIQDLRKRQSKGKQI